MKRILLVAPMLLAALAACSDDPSGPPPVFSLNILSNGSSRDSLSLAVGDSARLQATPKDSRGQLLTGRAVSWESSNNAVASVTSDGLVRAVAEGRALIVARADERADTVRLAIYSNDVACAPGQTGLQLQPGQAHATTAAEAGALCVEGGAAGSEYVLMPFFASTASGATLAVEVAAGGVGAVVGPPDPSASPLAPSFSRSALGARGDGGFHDRLRRSERTLTPLVPGARAARALPGLRPRYQTTAATPQVGDLLQLNAQAESACTNANLRTGRVVAIGTRALVVADTANPAGGFTTTDYQNVAATFDTLIYPVNVENFGAPTDIDQSERVIIFYTRAVNELTPANVDYVIGGFFFARDLFPKTTQPGFQACPGSNYAEMFYMLAPDPAGLVNNNKRSTEYVLNSTIGTVGHEFQHLINAARRLYVVQAEAWNEETWLNEGLSHVAEELLFYRASGAQPRQNLSIEALRAEAQIVNAFNSYQAQNAGRLIRFLQAPETQSPIADNDDLGTRGSAWAFLRYAADRAGGQDQALWSRLVNSSTTGLANLRAALNAEPIVWLQDWSTSVYTDDAVPVEARYTQPSWNFRSIMPAFSSTQGRYPLKTIALSNTQPTPLALQAGGAAYLRFSVGAGSRAAVRATSGGVPAPSTLLLTLVRTR